MFSLERLYKFWVQTNFQKLLGPKKNFASEKKCQKNFGPKIFVLKKNFGSEKISKNFLSPNKNFGLKKSLGLKKFWVEFSFGTNIISGLEILGPKKIWVWKKKFGSKKIFEKRI